MVIAMGRSMPLSSHLWGSRAGVGRKAKLHSQCGPSLATQGVKLETGLSSSLPHSGEGLEELSKIAIVGMGHCSGGGKDNELGINNSIIILSQRYISKILALIDFCSQ